jgi:cell wall-associated NlpC family hydrolase
MFLIVIDPRRLTISLLTLGLLMGSVTACSTRPPVSSSTKPANASVVNIAKNMLGVRYRYGGRSPRTGFDCSGLVYYSHQRSGIAVPRTAQEQYRAAKPVLRSALRSGDLVFFRIYGNSVSHVGIYLGNNRFIHAPASGKQVSIARMDDSYWRRRFAGGGRI